MVGDRAYIRETLARKRRAPLESLLDCRPVVDEPGVVAAQIGGRRRGGVGLQVVDPFHMQA